MMGGEVLFSLFGIAVRMIGVGCVRYTIYHVKSKSGNIDNHLLKVLVILSQSILIRSPIPQSYILIRQFRDLSTREAQAPP